MRKRRILRWMKTSTWADRLLALCALAPLIVLLVRQVMELGNTSVPCCDFAALELGTRAFLRGEQFFGLYSREGWRHPGPAPFMWSALFRPIPGQSFAEHQIGAALLSLGAVATVIIATWNRVTNVGRSIVITVMAVFVVRFDLDYLRSPWNPYGSAMWVSIAVICTAVFTQTRSSLSIGFAVFAGSMAAQTHVGAAPTVAVCFAVILVSLFRSRQRRETRRNALTAGSVFAFLWFLPFADLAFGQRNLLRILRSSSVSSEGMDVSEMLNGVLWLFGHSPGKIGETFGPSSPYVEARDVLVLDVVAIVVVVGLAVVALARRRLDRFPASLSALVLASAALTIGALVINDSEFLRYLLLPIAGLGPLLWVVAGVTASGLLQRHERNIIRILAWPVVLCLSVISIIGLSPRDFTDPFVNNSVQTVAHQIADDCSALPQRAVVDVAEDVEWFDALPVIVGIERCVKVRVIGHVGFLAGQPYRAEVDSAPNVHVTAEGSPSTSTVIASSEVLTVSVEKK